MRQARVKDAHSEFGTARLGDRYKLLPRAEEVPGLLTGEDLFFFARFKTARVKEILVPRYGRERRIPLFDFEKSESLTIKRPLADYS